MNTQQKANQLNKEITNKIHELVGLIVEAQELEQEDQNHIDYFNMILAVKAFGGVMEDLPALLDIVAKSQRLKDRGGEILYLDCKLEEVNDYLDNELEELE